MEPIRPDDDELRADEPFGGAEPREQVKPRAKPEKPTEPPKSPKPPKDSGRAGGGALVWGLLVIVAVAAGAGWYLQEQRIQVLESQLQDADYWARQSNLALARFEGELSETGESLQERGARLEQQIASNEKRLDSADSEIRKLWVIANEKNKQRLNEQQQKIVSLEKQLAGAEKSVSDVDARLEKVRTGLVGDVAQVSERLKSAVAALEQADRAAEEQLAAVGQKIDGVEPLVERRLKRFEQEQKLGIDGLEARIATLEKKVGSQVDGREVRALKAQLSELKQAVASIDASRAQLTSRLVRLSEEVNQLRSGAARQ
ncbi:bifunctional uroporphyrinogen-III synthetase/uroporphyrin-III C-methyltransferase [Marinobacter litoralis]|uniref:Bifunctional uroporphyrinogen-III synthetase/uroporphyrin-III C-methyltransferase n=1 Tax=Marinobacter litoralis TaxID=187981 RepID=A0A3M2RLG7_9GAMM|nr:hypothetical protein [Marinobacter litoralis]RMJ05765.1 bifunctional uroporphyrinogen-III synthetase/uroporphyrin-III C-methyltransferase [Marinobacter litoralis]